MGCGTLALTGLGLAGIGAGAGMGMTAASQEQKGMNDAVNADLLQMQKFRQQGMDVFNKSLGQSTPQAAEQLLQQGQDRYSQAATKALATPMAQSGASQLMPTNQAVSNARANLANTASSNYKGWSNIPLQWSLQGPIDATQLGIINEQSVARNALLPTLVQLASQSQQGRASLGKLLGAVGSLALGGGLGMMGSGGAAGAGSSLGAGYSTPEGLAFAGNAGAGLGQQAAWMPMASLGF